MFGLDRPGAINARLGAPSKKALLGALAQQAARAHGLESERVQRSLSEREKLGVTGFGGGVALPHARLPELDQVVAVFARLSAPLDYQAMDDAPIDLAFALLSPVGGDEHLRALAAVSRLLRRPAVVAKLRSASSDDAILALLEGEELAAPTG